jgi:hypothetical protein
VRPGAIPTVPTTATPAQPDVSSGCRVVFLARDVPAWRILPRAGCWPAGHGYRLEPYYLRARRCRQLLPGRRASDQIQRQAAPAAAEGPGPEVDDANARAIWPGPGPVSCASAESARGDPARRAGRTVRSWRRRACRGSGSRGLTPPHARCRSYGTGKRRLSSGSPPRNNGPRVQAVGQKRTPGHLPQPRCNRCCSCRGPEQYPDITPRPLPRLGHADTDHRPGPDPTNAVTGHEAQWPALYSSRLPARRDW